MSQRKLKRKKINKSQMIRFKMKMKDNKEKVQRVPKRRVILNKVIKKNL